MKSVLYVWKSHYHWEIRVHKICRALLDERLQIFILSRWQKGEKQKEFLDGYNVTRVGFEKPSLVSVPLSFNPFWQKSIIQSIEEIKPDLVIVRDFFLAESTAKIAHRFNIPVIMDMSEHYPAAMRGWDKYSETFLPRLAVHNLKIPDYLEKKAVKAMDGIITVSDELSYRLNQKFDYPYEKMKVVHNTPDLNIFENVRKGSSKPPKVFGYHGYFSPDRNLEKLVRGFILAAQQDREIELVMAGEMNNKTDCVKIATQSVVSDRISFTGRYEHKDIDRLYSETDIGLLPFKNNEFINHIIANKFFDYMACGKPLLVSEAAPMRRIIEETKAGIVVDCSKPENIAEAILTFKSIDTGEFSRNGIYAAESKYNWSVDSKIMLNFIQKLI